MVNTTGYPAHGYVAVEKLEIVTEFSATPRRKDEHIHFKTKKMRRIASAKKTGSTTITGRYAPPTHPIRISQS